MPHLGGRRKRHRKHRGGNIFEDIYNNVLKPVHHFVKENKLVSRGLNLLPHAAAKTIAEVADKAGYGKRRRHRGGRMAGGRKHHGHAKAILV